MPNQGRPICRNISQRLTALACAAVFVLQSGCALLPEPPVKPNTQYQSTLGRVAVVAVPQQPEIKFKGMISGKGEGAIRGAGSTFGSCVGMLGQGSCSGAMCGAAYIVWFGVCTVAGAVGGVVGAVTTPSTSKVHTTQLEMSTALKEKIIQESLADGIVATAIAEGNHLVTLAPESAESAAKLRDYRSLAAGADTVLEVALTKVGTMGLSILAKEANVDDVKVALPLSMTAHVRLIRTSDNAELFAAEYVFLGERFKQSDWSAEEVERLLHNLQIGYETMGKHIYDNVFMLYPFPELRRQSAGFMVGAFGLAPIYPRMAGATADNDVFFYPSHWTTVDSLQPTLRWQGFPREIDIKAAPEEMRRVKNVRYDLVIAQERNLAPSDVVYRREGLPEPVHTLESSLRPGTRYFWSVRARFELDGRERVTDWGNISSWFREKWTSPSAQSYRFKTP